MVNRFNKKSEKAGGDDSECFLCLSHNLYLVMRKLYWVNHSKKRLRFLTEDLSLRSSFISDGRRTFSGILNLKSTQFTIRIDL